MLWLQVLALANTRAIAHRVRSYWMEPGTSDCQPKAAGRALAGAEMRPPRSLPPAAPPLPRLSVSLASLVSLSLPCRDEGQSRLRPSASPPLVLPASRALLSAAPWLPV